MLATHASRPLTKHELCCAVRTTNARTCNWTIPTLPSPHHLPPRFPLLNWSRSSYVWGTLLFPSFVLPAAIIWRSVCHPLPPAKPRSRLAQRSVPEPARLSSLPSTPILPLADLTTKRRFLLKEGKKKTKKYVQGKKERKKRKKKREPHRQCCQVNNKCASSVYTLHNKNNMKARYGLTERWKK